jgi:hypothetical protein
LAARTRPSRPVTEIRESFDKQTPFPDTWSYWGNQGRPSFTLSADKSLSPPRSLAVTGISRLEARAWLRKPLPADVQVSAAVLVDTLIPAQVIARGTDLDSASPTFYAAAVSRGVEVQLLRVVRGKVTRLASLKSTRWVSQRWLRVTLQVRKKVLQVRICHLADGQYLDDSGAWTPDPVWALRQVDAAIKGPGHVGLGRPVSYQGTVFFDDFTAGPARSTAADAAEEKPRPAADTGLPDLPRPTIPRHYPHIRIAMLAYTGNPMGAFEEQLLRKSVDLVVPSDLYLRRIKAVAPRTPQLLYTNTSSLYLELLTDWLAYADAHRLSREEAFFHARRATPFRGNSPSSQPVTWFWDVVRDGHSPANLTQAAHTGAARLWFGLTGESVCVGYPERFREINFEMIAGGQDGWQAVVEYARAVDDAGKPVTWGRLPLRGDTTAGLAHSGRITFDPPADWKPSSSNGKARLFYVRFRATAPGTPAVARSILGRDYVIAHGKDAGVIPAFDFQADLNHDGYLDDVEYAHRASGKNARFVYESRLPNESYGQMRFCTNPAGAGFRRWAVDYHVRFLKPRPLAAGLFMDNSDGRPSLPQGEVVEPLHRFGKDYGSLLQEIAKAISPRWILANSPSHPAADTVVRANPAYMIEFALRPLAHPYGYFEDLSETLARRRRLTSPPPITIIDSYPQGSTVNDPRLRLATLAEYYLLADPQSTYLMLYGGFDPAAPWARHWMAAIEYDIGQPLGHWSLWTTGPDPSNRSLSYRIYRRKFQSALVVFKPLSHARGFRGKPSTGDDSATRHDLGPAYRPLRADGTLGEQVTTITLRNGEGAILIKNGQ